MKKTRKALLNSIISLMLCFSMLLGTTYAWFTDEVTSTNNIIKSGMLDLEMYWTEDLDSGEWKDASQGAIFNYDHWEPGYTDIKYVKIVNNGNLAFQYALNIIPNGVPGILAEVIDVYYQENAQNNIANRQLTGMTKAGVLSQLMGAGTAAGGVLLPEGKSAAGFYSGDIVVALGLHMQEDADNKYQNQSIGASFAVRLLATQYTYEQDSFGKDYDADAMMPDVGAPDFSFNESVSATVNGAIPAEGLTIGEGGQISAEVASGTALEDGTTSMTLSVSTKEQSDANLSIKDNETVIPMDVHVSGVAANNATPIIVTVRGGAPTGLNKGNLSLYHVESDGTKAMTEVATVAELVAHNQFCYDPATGDLVLALCSFSEVAVVADTVNAWNGDFDYSWYTNAVAPLDGEAVTEYTIANADQLAAFGAIVGGMAKDKDSKAIKQDSFAGKTVKLLADINLGDNANANESLIFHPIGYYYTDDKNADGTTGDYYSTVNSFKGTFDGNGHTISNFYQNTWEIEGDYDGNYYSDAMGLFGYVVNGTVKNLTVDNFSSDGEFTPTGVIAAYADGDTIFENIAITNCNPRVYNTGNGGIIGIAGSTSAANDDHITLKNITVDNSNKISALWGSWDVACGGLVGMYRGNVDGSGNATGDTISFEYCHVAAQIDVYNDVCANYQYYAYRYAGMMIGSVRHNTTSEGKTIPNMTGISATGCTVNYGDWNDYYYCEFEKNTIASYSEDYQFSRVPHSELNFTDSNGNGVVDADERASVTGCKHTHTAEEDKQAVYLPFHQLFTGYSWGVSSIGLKEYSGIVTNLDIIEGDQEESVEKFETKFTGDFLYRVGNQNTVSLGSLFSEIATDSVIDSGVWVTVEKVDENTNVSGTFTANTSDWTKGTIQFSGTGVVKVTIQDYNFCTPTVLTLEVVDATNITSATGTTTGGNFVLLCDVNTSTYVNYWNCTLYGNGFTYSLNGAPTAYNSKQGHGILITKNATLDNLVIVGDVYNSYGAYTNQDYYNTAVDVVDDTTIQNCYISGCAAPVSTRANATITNTTLYGGTVANLIIKSGTVTLEDVTTANYDDGRSLVGMGIVIHSDATESTKLVLNGTLTQYNFISEAKVPTDTYAKNLHTTMFGDSCSKYHFGTSPNRYVNAGIVSLTALFNAEGITDNANTGYVGTAVSLSSVNGYVYTQPNTSGSVNNNYDKDTDSHVATTQGAVPPSYRFDYTNKNYVAKTAGSNDYCYEENGKVNISMDEGDTFNWDTSILTIGKGVTNYTVSMNGTDYTGKSIDFNTAGDYKVVYTYTDDNNYKLDENGNITTYSETYTKTVNITVAVVEAATKHAEFTFGSSNTASTTVTVGNNTYVMPNVSATSSTIGSTTVSGQTIYYPIVEIVMSDGKTSHTSGWYAYFPVFSGAVTITDYKDNGLGKAETFGSSTQSMPSGLSIVGDPAQLFKYQSSSTAGTSPVVKNNILVYSSPSISAKRSEYNTVIQYSYQDNAGATYYYYIGYHAPAQSYSSCVTPDTLVTLADGSQKRVDELSASDKILAWDFFTGNYAEKSISLLVNHGEAFYRIANLQFSDRTELRIIGDHGIFDYDLNKFVYITVDNMEDYIGHRFVQHDEGGYNLVTLNSAYETEEYTSAWSITSAGTSNAFASGLLTVAPPEDFYNWIEMEGKLRYDAEQFAKDVETYGLYTYEDFADYVTYEQFIDWNGAYLKIAVEKGYFTFDYILELIELYKGWMPNN